MAARKAKDEQPEIEVDGGVLVAITGDKRQVQTLGNTKVMELPTLLRQAAKDVERELGID